MRLYTKKKLHAKSPVAVRITYSVREDTLEVSPGERVFFCRMRPRRSFVVLVLRTPHLWFSFAFDKPGLVYTGNSHVGSLFPGESRMSTALRQQRVPSRKSQRDRKHIRPAFVRDFSPVFLWNPGRLIRISANTRPSFA